MILRYRSSHYRNIQLSLIFFILIPVTLVSLLSYYQNKAAMMDNIRLANEHVLDVIAKDVSAMVDDIAYTSNLLNQIQSLDVLASFDYLKDKESIHTYESYMHMNRIADFSSFLFVKTTLNMRMFILNNRNMPVLGHVEPNMLSAMKASQFMDQVNLADSNSLQWIQETHLPESSREYYYAARVIRNPKTGVQYGVLYVGVPISYFQELFRSEQGAISMFDEKGGKIAQGGKWKAEHSVPMFVLQHRLSRNGWKLTYERPMKEITGQISRTFYVSALTIGSSAILFLLLSISFARTLNRPIRKLKQIAEQYGNGNRTIRFPIGGQDEIAVLGQSINTMLDQIDELLKRIEHEQEEKRVMELQALFSQIRPHFLLNTLNSIKCKLVVSGDRIHSSMIDALMSLLRAYTRAHEPALLEDEARLMQDYVTIMQMRSGLKIAYVVSIEPECKSVMIPRLLIQPLIENAIIHGFTKWTDQPRIQLMASMVDKHVILSISDNGKGVSPEKLLELKDMLDKPNQYIQTGRKSIGLLNIAQRLKLTFGSSAFMSVETNEMGGLRFILSFAAADREGVER